MFQPTLHTYLWLSPLSVGGLSQFHTIIQYRKAHPTVVKALMSSGKSYSLVGVQDTDKAIRHTRLSADERKRLSSLANWKPLGAFSIAGEDNRFLILIRSVLVAFTSI